MISRNLRTLFATLALACCVLAAASAHASRLQLTGVSVGDQVDWTVALEVLPPAGSIGAEIALEVPAGTLLTDSIEVHPDFAEVLGGIPIINPGNNPFTGTKTEGVTTHLGVSPVFGLGDSVDAIFIDGIFAALGSTNFGSPGFKEALTFSTSGSTGVATLSGLIEQGGGSSVGGSSFNGVVTTTVVPEPTALAVAGIAVPAMLVRRRRRG